jgi:zeaxanthin glucosyltransferase
LNRITPIFDAFRRPTKETFLLLFCHAQGIPQLAFPITYDQPGVAARIAHKRTGVVTSLDKLTVDHLAFLLEEVLTNPTYRENARKLQKAIAEANGLSVAAELIEGSIGMSRKVSASRLTFDP